MFFYPLHPSRTFVVVALEIRFNCTIEVSSNDTSYQSISFIYRVSKSSLLAYQIGMRTEMFYNLFCVLTLLFCHNELKFRCLVAFHDIHVSPRRRSKSNWMRERGKKMLWRACNNNKLDGVYSSCYSIKL